MPQLIVKHKQGQYPVYIAASVLQKVNVFAEYIANETVVVISQAAISKHYLALVKQKLSNNTVLSIEIANGEVSKQWSTIESIIQQLVDKQCHRDTTIIALGGGVVGDVAGFVASIYQRGVKLIHVPTSLVSQVDSSIGGKTAINIGAYKNWVGTYYPPAAVFIDPLVLLTLPKREYHSGFAEMIKVGLVYDADYFNWLEEHIDKLIMLDSQLITIAIQRACAIKADIVSQDEQETQGLRLLLNFGHTFGHALERITDYKRYLHGEAVAIGMMLALEYSEKMCHLHTEIRVRLRQLLQRLALPAELPNDISLQQVLQTIQYDKKHTSQVMRLVFLKNLGQGMVKEFVDNHSFYTL